MGSARSVPARALNLVASVLRGVGSNGWHFGDLVAQRFWVDPLGQRGPAVRTLRRKQVHDFVDLGRGQQLAERTAMTALPTALALRALMPRFVLRTSAGRVARRGLVRVARVLPELFEQDLDLLGQRDDSRVLLGDPGLLLGDPLVGGRQLGF